MIEIHGLQKKFGDFIAVDGISLNIPRGQFFGFLGPNGAGKTTTIKMMTGLYEPTDGQVLIGGFDVQKEPIEAKRILGYVPDQPYLYEKLTGREFLHFVAGLYGSPPREAEVRISRLVDLFEITPFVDRRAEEYSQGMRQRIVLTAALLHDPQVLIIDEPLVGLDPRSARLVKDTLKQKTRDGLTIFMSTHLLEIVEELCDRIAIIKDGRLIHDETQGEGKGFNGQLERIFLDLTK